MTSKDLLSNYLKSTKEEHFNFIRDKDYLVSTGSLIMDIEVGGGLHPSILRFSGVSGGGKTSCSLSVMKNFLMSGEKNRKALYIKAEGRLSKDIVERSGIKFVEDAADWEDCTCFVFKTNIYETAANLIHKLVQNNEEETSYFFIIDSMDALIPKGDKDKTFEDAVKVSGGAAISSHFLKKMALPFSVGGHICAMISQVRSEVKINQYAKSDPRLTNASGGSALLHYSDWIFEFAPRYKSDYITTTVNGKEENVGHWAKITFKKSPNEKDGKEIRYPIKHKQNGGNSVWVEYEIADLMLMWELAKKSGAWIKIEPSLIEELKSNNISFPETIQGIDNLRSTLSDNQEATSYLFKKFKELCIS
jgi:RecA/RadA recombinase